MELANGVKDSAGLTHDVSESRKTDAEELARMVEYELEPTLQRAERQVAIIQDVTGRAQRKLDMING